jgi:hypothetical protein
MAIPAFEQAIAEALGIPQTVDGVSTVYIVNAETPASGYDIESVASVRFYYEVNVPPTYSEEEKVEMRFDAEYPPTQEFIDNINSALVATGISVPSGLSPTFRAGSIIASWQGSSTQLTGLKTASTATLGGQCYFESTGTMGDCSSATGGSPLTDVTNIPPVLAEASYDSTTTSMESTLNNLGSNSSFASTLQAAIVATDDDTGTKMAIPLGYGFAADTATVSRTVTSTASLMVSTETKKAAGEATAENVITVEAAEIWAQDSDAEQSTASMSMAIAALGAVVVVLAVCGTAFKRIFYGARLNKQVFRVKEVRNPTIMHMPKDEAGKDLKLIDTIDKAWMGDARIDILEPVIDSKLLPIELPEGDTPRSIASWTYQREPAFFNDEDPHDVRLGVRPSSASAGSGVSGSIRSARSARSWGRFEGGLDFDDEDKPRLKEKLPTLKPSLPRIRTAPHGKRVKPLSTWEEAEGYWEEARSDAGATPADGESTPSRAGSSREASARKDAQGRWVVSPQKSKVPAPDTPKRFVGPGLGPDYMPTDRDIDTMDLASPHARGGVLPMGSLASGLQTQAPLTDKARGITDLDDSRTNLPPLPGMANLQFQEDRSLPFITYGADPLQISARSFTFWEQPKEETPQEWSEASRPSSGYSQKEALGGLDAGSSGITQPKAYVPDSQSLQQVPLASAATSSQRFSQKAAGDEPAGLREVMDSSSRPKEEGQAVSLDDLDVKGRAEFPPSPPVTSQAQVARTFSEVDAAKPELKQDLQRGNIEEGASQLAASMDTASGAGIVQEQVAKADPTSAPSGMGKTDPVSSATASTLEPSTAGPSTLPGRAADDASSVQQSTMAPGATLRSAAESSDLYAQQALLDQAFQGRSAWGSSPSVDTLQALRAAAQDRPSTMESAVSWGQSGGGGGDFWGGSRPITASMVSEPSPLAQQLNPPILQSPEVMDRIYGQTMYASNLHAGDFAAAAASAAAAAAAGTGPPETPSRMAGGRYSPLGQQSPLGSAWSDQDPMGSSWRPVSPGLLESGSASSQTSPFGAQSSPYKGHPSSYGAGSTVLADTSQFSASTWTPYGGPTSSPEQFYSAQSSFTVQGSPLDTASAGGFPMAMPQGVPPLPTNIFDIPPHAQSSDFAPAPSLFDGAAQSPYVPPSAIDAAPFSQVNANPPAWGIGDQWHPTTAAIPHGRSPTSLQAPPPTVPFSETVESFGNFSIDGGTEAGGFISSRWQEPPTRGQAPTGALGAPTRIPGLPLGLQEQLRLQSSPLDQQAGQVPFGNLQRPSGQPIIPPLLQPRPHSRDSNSRRPLNGWGQGEPTPTDRSWSSYQSWAQADSHGAWDRADARQVAPGAMAAAALQVPPFDDVPPVMPGTSMLPGFADAANSQPWGMGPNAGNNLEQTGIWQNSGDAVDFSNADWARMDDDDHGTSGWY